MGANSSSTGFIYIELDDTNLRAGEEVRGKLGVSIKEPCNITGIDLTISGFECAIWEENKDTYRGKHTIFTQTLSLGRDIEATSFTTKIPFKLRLPEDLPASFQLGSKKDSAVTCVRYEIQACVSSRGKNRNLTCTRDFQVSVANAGETCQRANKISAESTMNLPSSCMVNKGSVVMELRVEESSFQRGDTIDARLYTQNRSQKPIKSHFFQLEQSIKMKSDCGKKRSVHVVVASEEHPGCERGGKNDNKLQLRVPSVSVANSYKGKLLRISYAVQGVGKMRCVEQPKVRVPVVIYSGNPGVPAKEVKCDDQPRKSLKDNCDDQPRKCLKDTGKANNGDDQPRKSLKDNCGDQPRKSVKDVTFSDQPRKSVKDGDQPRKMPELQLSDAKIEVFPTEDFSIYPTPSSNPAWNPASGPPQFVPNSHPAPWKIASAPPLFTPN